MMSGVEKFGGGERGRPWPQLAGLLLALVLSACATAPVGVMAPIGEPPADGSTVNMLVATTRASTNDPREPYSGERGEQIMLNEVVVSIPPARNRMVGEVQWPRQLPPDPERDFATVSVTPVKSEAAANDWFKRRRTASGRLLVFVHGFNNRFESAVYRFAQIAHDSGTGAAPLLFTWPSRGSVFAYGYDKESTNYSRTALETVLSTAAADKSVGEITLLAHSMGTWLTVEALRQMAIRQGRVPPKIANVILAAPDLDIDVFRQQIADMGPERPRFVVFVSRDDRALFVSRRLSGNVERLGQIDIGDPAIRDLLEKEGIIILDLSALRGGDSLNHSKFAVSPEVVKLLGDRLIAGQTITDQNIGLGAHLGAAALSVGNTVGSAAGLAVSVPISIVDPATRADLDDQADRFGNSLGGAIYGVVPGASGARFVCDRSRKACQIEPPEKGGR
jgi:Uncharacterized protein conserved in bacteria